MKSKNTTAVLALLFGMIGVHRFYLGQTILGLIYILLLVSGLGIFFMPFVCLGEVIYFLSMDKDKFDRDYNGEHVRCSCGELFHRLYAKCPRCDKENVRGK